MRLRTTVVTAVLLIAIMSAAIVQFVILVD
ncbi:MAG: Uncharacterised protein [Acidimicrobiales bacterium AG-410-I20]|nr:MAG: Uncharacterised protein [Acidimicrobiales bacterium AG-410-I20]